jgi:hypothetical protein
MGLNIIIYKIVGTSLSGNYYETENQDWFDDDRYSGDRDFVANNEFYSYRDIKDGCEYSRPADFNKCREWIKQNVVEFNQARLLEAIDKMESDKDLVFKFSW